MNAPMMLTLEDLVLVVRAMCGGACLPVRYGEELTAFDLVVVMLGSALDSMPQTRVYTFTFAEPRCKEKYVIKISPCLVCPKVHRRIKHQAIILLVNIVPFLFPEPRATCRRPRGLLGSVCPVVDFEQQAVDTCAYLL